MNKFKKLIKFFYWSPIGAHILVAMASAICKSCEKSVNWTGLPKFGENPDNCGTFACKYNTKYLRPSLVSQ